MLTRTTLWAVVAVAGIAGGCKGNPDAQTTTGPYSTPDYAGTHYNPGVNSGGSGLGSSNPAVGGASGSELNGGTRANTALPGDTGTASQNGGSGSPSGATGSSAASGR